MRKHVDEAYVLRTHPFGDADLIVTLLSERSGRVRGVARSARKSRRRFGGALEPLTRVTATWTEKQGRELHRLDSMEPSRSYAVLQSEPVQQAACAILAEVTSFLAREEQPDARGFRLLGAVLDALEAGLDPWIAVRYFEYWTLRLHGVLPDIGQCGLCGKSLSEGSRRVVRRDAGLACTACASSGGASGRRLRPIDIAFLEHAAARPPAEMAEHGEAARSGGALETLLRGTLESFVERRFRAYRHLEPFAADTTHGSRTS